MRRLAISALALAAAAAASAGPNAGAGGAFFVGVNMPAWDDLSQEFDVLGLATPTTAFNFGGTFRYSFANGVQIGYYGAGGGVNTGDVFPDDIVKECDVSFGVHHAVGGYKFYFGERLGLFAGAGAGVFMVEYVKTISNSPYRFGNVPFPGYSTFVSELEGVNWSAQVFAAPQYRLRPWFAVGVEAGYMHMKIAAGEMKQAGVITPAAPEMDLSGPFVRVGPMFNF